MNQILITKLIKKSEKIKQYKGLFIVSIFSIIILAIIYFSYLLQLNKEKQFSELASQNYHVYKLFAQSDYKNLKYKDSDIYGNISIPKINLNTPFFYGINEKLLKIYPCRFYGDVSEKQTNLCIAGHNYNDDRFFSNIWNLKIDDLIIIEDNNKNKYKYFVYKKFQIEENEIQTIIDSSNKKELTLLTCNNSNNKRFVVKAKTESLY